MDTTVKTGPCLRLLQCWDCKSVEELPDFTGLPEDDVILQYADEKHGGQTQQPHTRTLMRVEKAHWEDRTIRMQIHRQMWADTKGFVPEYYHTKSTMQEDAAKCFAAHRRSVPCIDYQDSSKRLGNPAASARRQLSRETGQDFTGGGPKIYLCSFCPVQQAVDQAKLNANANHQF
jgi:hypothetical protein